MFILLFFIGHL